MPNAECKYRIPQVLLWCLKTAQTDHPTRRGSVAFRANKHRAVKPAAKYANQINMQAARPAMELDTGFPNIHFDTIIVCTSLPS